MNKFFSIQFNCDSDPVFYGVNSIVSISRDIDHHSKEKVCHTVLNFSSREKVRVVGDYLTIRKSLEDFESGNITELVLKEYTIQFVPFVL